MTTRRRTKKKAITLRSYDYLLGMRLVQERMIERGEAITFDRHELDRMNVAVEVCAEEGYTNAQAVAVMRETADNIITERGRTLFAPYDENENMGDETINPSTVAA